MTLREDIEREATAKGRARVRASAIRDAIRDGGKSLSREDANKLIAEATERRPRDEDFKPATHKEIVIRIFRKDALPLVWVKGEAEARAWIAAERNKLLHSRGSHPPAP